jgi:hypothetical protein
MDDCKRSIEGGPRRDSDREVIGNGQAAVQRSGLRDISNFGHGHNWRS